jgi:hypothetical protein
MPGGQTLPTFTQTGLTTNIHWTSVTSDTTGVNLYALGTLNGTVYVYCSKNSGGIWSQIYSNTYTGSIYNIDCDPGGKYVILRIKLAFCNF